MFKIVVVSCATNHGKAIVGTGATGAVRVTKSNSILSMVGFTYFLLLIISNVNPLSSSVGSIITISGHNFSNVTSVTIGGVPATLFTILNDSTITAVVGISNNNGVVVSNFFGSATFNGFVINRSIFSNTGLTISPCPANNFFDVFHPITTNAYIKLVSLDGRKLLELNCLPNSTQTRVNTSLISSGFYTVVWHDSNITITQRTIIIH